MDRTRFAFYPPVRILSSQISSHFTGSPFRSSQFADYPHPNRSYSSSLQILTTTENSFYYF